MSQHFILLTAAAAGYVEAKLLSDAADSLLASRIDAGAAEDVIAAARRDQMAASALRQASWGRLLVATQNAKESLAAAGVPRPFAAWSPLADEMADYCRRAELRRQRAQGRA